MEKQAEDKGVVLDKAQKIMIDCLNEKFPYVKKYYKTAEQERILTGVDKGF